MAAIDPEPRPPQSIRLPPRATHRAATVAFENGDLEVVVTSDKGLVHAVPIDAAGIPGDAVRRRPRTPTAGEGFDRHQTKQLTHHGVKAASVRRDGTVRIHYPGELPTELRWPEGRLARALWSPTGDRLLTFSTDRRIAIWSTFVRSGRRPVWSGDARRFAFTVSRSETAEHSEVWTADGSRQLLSLPGRDLRFSRDGSRLLTVTRDGFRIWDDSGRPRVTLAAGAFDHRLASTVRFSPGGDRVAALFRRRGGVWVLGAGGGDAAGLPETAAARDLVWSGDGRYLAVIGSDHARLWETGDWRRPRLLPRPADRLEWTADGSRMLTCDGDGVWLWPGDGRGQGVRLTGRPVRDAAWSPGGRWLAVVYAGRGSESVSVELLPVDGLELASGRQRRALPQWPRPGSTERAAFSAGGSRLLTTGRLGAGSRASAYAQVWHTDDSGRVHALPRHTRSLEGAAISAGGRRVLTEDANRGVRSIRLWQADGPLVLASGEHGLEEASWSPDGHRVATVATTGEVEVWSATDPGPPTSVCRDISSCQPPSAGRLTTPAWSPDSRQLVTFAGDVFFVHDLGDRARREPPPRRRFAGHAARITGVAWSPRGRFLLSTSRDGTARIWNVRTTLPLAVLAEHSGAVLAGAWSDDGRRVATVDQSGSLTVWPVPAAVH